jgi:short subunit dehydrogenase-like uncharacterized protein
MSKNGWMIYGAYGYTGELIVQEAVRRGHRPRLAGRSPAKLEELAARFALPWIALDLSEPKALARALEDVALVFHAAGPFVDTSEAMIRACLAARAHYVDITGEVSVFRNTLGHDEAAEARSVALISGVGFDVVPTDCLARHVAERVTGATELELAIAPPSNASPGTVKSMFDGLLIGGLARRNGALVPHALGKDSKRVRFADRERGVIAIPWGDLETAYRTTRIPNITTYMALPSAMVAVASVTWPLIEMSTPLLRSVLGRRAVREKIASGITSLVKGPDEETRDRGRAFIWARASTSSGHFAEAWLETPDSYAFTALAGVRAVERILAKHPVGALTPALAFGSDFVLEIEGTQRRDALFA